MIARLFFHPVMHLRKQHIFVVQGALQFQLNRLELRYVNIKPPSVRTSFISVKDGFDSVFKPFYGTVRKHQPKLQLLGVRTVLHILRIQIKFYAGSSG